MRAGTLKEQLQTENAVAVLGAASLNSCDHAGNARPRTAVRASTANLRSATAASADHHRLLQEFG